MLGSVTCDLSCDMIMWYMSKEREIKFSYGQGYLNHGHYNIGK